MHLYDTKGISDYGGYGYNFIWSLTPDRNINHADTYALFANVIYLDCQAFGENSWCKYIRIYAIYCLVYNQLHFLTHHDEKKWYACHAPSRRGC